MYSIAVDFFLRDVFAVQEESSRDGWGWGVGGRLLVDIVRSFFRGKLCAVNFVRYILYGKMNAGTTVR